MGAGTCPRIKKSENTAGRDKSHPSTLVSRFCFDHFLPPSQPQRLHESALFTSTISHTSTVLQTEWMMVSNKIVTLNYQKKLCPSCRENEISHFWLALVFMIIRWLVMCLLLSHAEQTIIIPGSWPGTQACRMGICGISSKNDLHAIFFLFFIHSDNIVTIYFTLEFLDHWVNFRVISEGGNSLLSLDCLSSELFSLHSSMAVTIPVSTLNSSVNAIRFAQSPWAKQINSSNNNVQVFQHESLAL